MELCPDFLILTNIREMSTPYSWVREKTTFTQIKWERKYPHNTFGGVRTTALQVGGQQPWPLGLSRVVKKQVIESWFNVLAKAQMTMREETAQHFCQIMKKEIMHKCDLRRKRRCGEQPKLWWRWNLYPNYYLASQTRDAPGMT